MRVLVTGATGFIGGHLVKALLESGHKVRTIARETSDCTSLESAGVDIKKGSICDLDFVTDACRDVDIAFNMAARLGGQSATINEMRAVNAQAVEILLEASRKNNVRQFVHCSTPGVVGMVGVAPECLPYRPSAPYERTKYEGERIALAYHRNNKIPVTVIRPDFVYGPGDMHKLKMFRAIKENRFPFIGSGDSLLHPTYVDDVVRGCMVVMGNQAALGETFNIAGPRPATVRELVKMVSDTLGIEHKNTRIPVIAAKLAAYSAEVMAKMLKSEPVLTRYQVNFFSCDHASDTSKAQQMLGFRPQVDLSEGIRHTVEWYIERGYL